eukprot:2415970-Ditylum_brightwellii.AAC.1
MVIGSLIFVIDLVLTVPLSRYLTSPFASNISWGSLPDYNEMYDMIAHTQLPYQSYGEHFDYMHNMHPQYLNLVTNSFTDLLLSYDSISAFAAQMCASKIHVLVVEKEKAAMQPVTCANVEDIVQQFCLVTLNDDDVLIFDTEESKLVTHNLNHFVGP